MTEIALPQDTLPTSPPEMVAKVTALEKIIQERPQVEIRTEHTFHAGMYARTVRVPAGVVFTSVLIKRATLLILNGVCDILAGSQGRRMEGYHVLSAAAGRKQVYISRSNLELTMIFPTEAKTVEEAEAEFTDEADILLSRKQQSGIVDTPCQASPPQPRSSYRLE